MRTSRAKAGLLSLMVALLAEVAAAQDGSDTGPVTRRPPGLAPEIPVPQPAPRHLRAPSGDRGTPAAEAAEVRPAALGPAQPVEPARQRLDTAAFKGVFAPYTVRNGREIPESLTGKPGDAVAGRRLYHNSSRTGCSLCHGSAEGPRAADDERTAPDLHRIGQRLSQGRLRLWVVAPGAIRPNTGMPSFHKPGQRDDPTDPLFGGPRLTAAEIEDIVAYLTRDAPEGGVTEPLDANVIPGQVPGVGRTSPGG